MMKSKRALSFFLTMAMVLSLLPTKVFVVEAESVENPLSIGENNIAVVSGETTKTESFLNNQLGITYSTGGSWSFADGIGYYSSVKNEGDTLLSDQVVVENKTDQILYFQCIGYYLSDIAVGDTTIEAGTEIRVNPGEDVIIDFKIAVDTYGILELNSIRFEETGESGILFQYDATLGSITVDGKAVASGERLDISTATIVATPKSGSGFLAWVDATEDANTLISNRATYSFTAAAGQDTVKVAFTNPNAPAWYKVGNHYVDDLNKAITFAQAASGSGKIIRVESDGIISGGTYEIPSGVTLHIPYSTSNDLLGDGYKPTLDTGESSFFNRQMTLKSIGESVPYRTLKLQNGAKITVKGTMIVNSAVFGSGLFDISVPHGPYGLVILEKDTQITVDGGTLNCYGYIMGSYDNQGNYSGGKVVAKSGSVYEMFQVRDMRGTGASTAGQGHSVFPMNQYYVQNIEAEYQVYSGALTYGVMMAASNGLLGITGYCECFVFIGKTDGLFQLSSGYLTRTYNPLSDRVEYSMYGDIVLDSISVELLGQSMSSSGYYLGLNGNISVRLESGAAVIKQMIKLLPGSSLYVAEETELTVDGTGGSLTLYDSEDWYVSTTLRQGFAMYPPTTDYVNKGDSLTVTYNNLGTAKNVVRFSPTRQLVKGTPTEAKHNSAELKIDGTLKIYGNVYSTDGYTSPDGSLKTAMEYDNILTGTGTIINYGAFNEELTLDEYYTNNPTFATVSTTPLLGMIVSEGGTLPTDPTSFSDGTVTYNGFYDAGTDEYYWTTGDLVTVNVVDESGDPLGSYKTILYDGWDAAEQYYTDADCQTLATSENFTGKDEEGNSVPLYALAVAEVIHTDGSEEDYYTSVNEAVSAARSGDTVRLMSDVTLKNTIEVKSGQNLILDLDNHSLTMAGTVISNYGVLAIDGGDKGDDKVAGKIASTSGIGIDNYGTITTIGGYLKIESVAQSIRVNSGALLDVLGGKDSHVEITQNAGTDGTKNKTLDVLGTINLIGGENAWVEIYQNCSKNSSFVYGINLSGKINTIGSTNATVLLKQTSSKGGWAIYMAGGKIGKIGGEDVNRVEINGLSYPVYLNTTSSIDEIGENTLFTATTLGNGDGGHGGIFWNRGKIKLISGGYFAVENESQNTVQKIFQYHSDYTTLDYIEQGKEVSETTTPITSLANDKTYNCYYVYKPHDEHIYGTPEFVWDGTTSAVAEFGCTVDGCPYVLSQNAVVTSAVTHSGGMTYKVVNTATAEYDGEEYTDIQSKTVTADKTEKAYYDDRLTGTGIEIIAKGEPTSQKVGSDEKDDAVIALVDGKLIATGIGTALAEISGKICVIEVTPAPISMFMITGHSIGMGSRGNTQNSVVIEDGKAYSFTATKITSSGGYAYTDMIGGSDGVGLGWAAEKRPPEVDNFTASGGGVIGEDSALAWKWNKLTGKKVYVVNCAVGSTSLYHWINNESNSANPIKIMDNAIANFTDARTILQNEVDAGHFVVEDMVFLNHSAANYSSGAIQYAYNDVEGEGWFQTFFDTMRLKLNKDWDNDGNVDEASEKIVIGYIPIWTRGGKVDFGTDKPATMYMGVSKDYPDMFTASLIGREWSSDTKVAEYFQSYDPGFKLQDNNPAVYPTTNEGLYADNAHYIQYVYNALGVDIATNVFNRLYGDVGEVSLKLLKTDGVTEVAVDNDVEVLENFTYDDTLTLVPVAEPIYVSDLTIEASGSLSIKYPLTIYANERGGEGSVIIKHGEKVLKTVTADLGVATDVAEIVRNGESVGRFLSLNKAITAAQAGDTVRLLADVTMTSTGITIGADKDIILDLNNHSISAKGSVITNRGKLSVYGGALDQTPGKLVNTNAADDSTINYCIQSVTGGVIDTISGNLYLESKGEFGATIWALGGTINTIGGPDSNVELNTANIGIYASSGGTIGVIGGENGNVSVSAGQYPLYVGSGSSVGAVGGKNATVSITSHGSSTGTWAIVNIDSGSIGTIGGENAKVTLADSKGKPVIQLTGSGNIGTIGVGGKVNIDSAGIGIFLNASGTKVGTIGLGNDSVVQINSVQQAIYVCKDAEITTLGGKNSKVIIRQVTGANGSSNFIEVDGKIVLIGDEYATVDMYQQYDKASNNAQGINLDSGAEITTLGGANSTVLFRQKITTSRIGFGIRNAGGTIGTIGAEGVKRVEFISTHIPLYVSKTNGVGNIGENTLFVGENLFTSGTDGGAVWSAGSITKIIGGYYGIGTSASNTLANVFYNGYSKTMAAIQVGGRAISKTATTTVTSTASEAAGTAAKNYTCYYVTDPIAKLVHDSASVNYAAVQDAVTDSQTGDTVVVLKDHDISSAISVASGKNLILNLNNHKITSSAGAISVSAGGTLSIIGGEKAEGKNPGKLIAKSTCIDVNGTINTVGGDDSIIELESTGTVVKVNNGGRVEMIGGKNTDVVVTGGNNTIYVAKGSMGTIGSTGTGKVTINSDQRAVLIMSSDAPTDKPVVEYIGGKDGKVEINGGMNTNANGWSACVYVANKNTLGVLGGENSQVVLTQKGGKTDSVITITTNGAINTIGGTNAEVNVTASSTYGIGASSGTIGTVGGDNATVNITSAAKHAISLQTSTITTIGGTDAKVDLIGGDYGIILGTAGKIESASTIGTIGGTRAKVNIVCTKASGASVLLCMYGGSTIGTIGGKDAEITMLQTGKTAGIQYGILMNGVGDTLSSIGEIGAGAKRIEVIVDDCVVFIPYNTSIGKIGENVLLVARTVSGKANSSSLFVSDPGKVGGITGGYYSRGNSEDIKVVLPTEIRDKANFAKTPVEVKSIADGQTYICHYVCLTHYYENGECIHCGKKHSTHETPGNDPGQEVAQIFGDKAYPTLQDAIDAYTGVGYIQLLMDNVTASVEFKGYNVYLELNGKALTLDSISDGKMIYLLDANTDGYGASTGSVTVSTADSERIASLTKYTAGEGMSTKYYVAIAGETTNDTVTYTANRTAVHVTGLQFAYAPSVSEAYLTFRGTFRGDDLAAGKLTDVGFMFDGSTKTWYSSPANGEEKTGSIEDIRKDQSHFFYTRKIQSIDDIVQAAALMQFGDETCEGKSVDVSKLLDDLKAQIDSADWTDAQKAAVNKFFNGETAN